VGLPLFEKPAGPPRRVAVYSCEDGDDVLQWRIANYCAALEIEPTALADRLRIINAAELHGPELFVPGTGRDSVGQTTPAYAALRQYMRDNRIDVLLVDNASDTFAASEISRPEVRSFFRHLLRLLPDKTGAVLLLGHVNRVASAGRVGSSGAQDGQNYSGSTAWHNSARSRWEVTRDTKGNGGGDDEADEAPTSAPYVLKRVKGNYAADDRTGLVFHWNHHHKVILPTPPLGPMVKAIDERNAQRAVLHGFAEAERMGARIACAVRANNNAAKVLAEITPSMPNKLREMRCMQPALLSLERRGFIEVTEYAKASRSSAPGKCWTLTDAGRAAAKEQQP
jgi:RecA-family ATPase